MVITEKVWLSEREAVEYTSLSRETIRKDREDGKITYRTKGSRLVYHISDLDCYMERITEKHISSAEAVNKILKKKNL
jgi:hypothetical protein